MEIYLKEKNPDLKKLKNILLSGKVNGLLSTQEILDIFVHLSEKYPNLVKKEKIGNTFKKEDLFYYHLSNDFKIKKSKILFTGAHHARELLSSVMVVKIFIEGLHSLIN